MKRAGKVPVPSDGLLLQSMQQLYCYKPAPAFDWHKRTYA